MVRGLNVQLTDRSTEVDGEGSIAAALGGVTVTTRY